MLAKPAAILVSKGPLSSLGTAAGENAQIATKNANSRKLVHNKSATHNMHRISKARYKMVFWLCRNEVYKVPESKLVIP